MERAKNMQRASAKDVDVLKAFLIEPDEASAMLLRADLDMDGLPVRFEWTCVATLAQAVRGLPTSGAHVILASLDLPDAKGVGVLHQVRRAAPGVPVVVVAEDDGLEAALDALRAGAQDHAVKDGEDVHGLARRIRFAVERARISMVPGPPPQRGAEGPRFAKPPLDGPGMEEPCVHPAPPL